jgi:saccharopine dehydrogenase (NAD+, L-lysine-forming)
MRKITIGILRETKDPPDRRVPLSPAQCRSLLERYSELTILVQPSANRCYTDQEYEAAGIPLAEDLSDCDVLMGVKEVRPDTLIGNKSYLFFSHTAKKQPYNRVLLKEVVRQEITLMDYEYLTSNQGIRVVAFGRWAGVVGAYNGLRGYGLKSGRYRLKPAHECFDLEEIYGELKKADTGNSRFAVTGGGRVAGGAVEILEETGVQHVGPDTFLTEEFGRAVYTRLDPWHYTRRTDREPFEFNHFVKHPGMYENNLLPYAAHTDILIACHYWDPASPVMLTREALAGGALPISLIADISCDINGPIASTIRASTIASPFYGYDPATGREADPFQEGVITVMAVDNLPGELPRDASTDFGEALMEHVVPELLGTRDTGMLDRASITLNGALTPSYAYLEDYLAGRE